MRKPLRPQSRPLKFALRWMESRLSGLADPEFKPDLIVLDFNIPRIPGIAILAQCKPAAPIVVFSSSFESG